MEKFDSRFGFFAPQAPPKRETPAVASPLLFEELVKTDGQADGAVPDPIGEFFSKAAFEQELTKRTSSKVIDFSWSSIVGIADTGELDKAAKIHPDGTETEVSDDGEIWKFHYQGGRLIKSELDDPRIGHMEFDANGNEVAVA